MGSDQQASDVIVVGAGMAGLVAARQAVENGATVTVVEKGPRAGGSMYYASGAIWCYNSLEVAREIVPEGDRALQGLIVESFDDDIRWLEEIVGVATREYEPGTRRRQLGPGEGAPVHGKIIDTPDFTEAIVEGIERRGGRIELDTPIVDLSINGQGRVTGATVRLPDGDRRTIESDAVVLATGRFQGNEQLVQQYITEDATDLRLRANPWSTGDGFRAAEAVGAKTTTGLGAFYGHNLAGRRSAPPVQRCLAVLRAVVDRARHERGAVHRRVGVPAGGGVSPGDGQVGGRAYLVIGDDLYHHPVERSEVTEEFGSIVERAEGEFGADVIRADSLEALGRGLDDRGVNGSNAVETIEAFNDAIRAGDGEQLDPPRTDLQNPIDTPPLYAVEVQPGITFTMGGLDVNERMQVLHQNASSSGLDPDYQPENYEDVFMRPSDGLYAAGADVGNVHYRRYFGGLATALVTGRIAGESVST